MRRFVIGVATAAAIAAGIPAMAYAAGGREATQKVVDAISKAENEYMSAANVDDDDGDAAFGTLEAVGKKYWADGSNAWKSDLSWIRGVGDAELEWKGYADVTSSSTSGCRVVWLCREKGSDKVVAIVRGSIKDDKVDSMHMDHTSRYSDLMSEEATKRNVQSMIDALSSGEQYSGRVPTTEDRESMAESRAWLREHGQSEVAGDGE